MAITPDETKRFREGTEYHFGEIIVNAWDNGKYGPNVSLAHQCDDWDIGSVAEVDELIEKLRDVQEWIGANLPPTP